MADNRITGMTTGDTRDYHYHAVQLKRANEKIEKMEIFIKGALAALSQNATFPADIEAAKTWLNDALNL